MSEFDKELLDVYIDMTEKYYELTNKLINIIKNQNSKIKEAIDLINNDDEYTDNDFEGRQFQKDLLKILERND